LITKEEIIFLVIAHEKNVNDNKNII